MNAGNDATNPARYHPFYITDSSEGGFGQKTEEEQRRQRIFAGVRYDSEGYPYPTAGKYKNIYTKTSKKIRISSLNSWSRMSS